MTTGNISAMSRVTTRPAPVRSALAAPNRSCSHGSRTNARTTRMPVICSRRIRFTSSTADCIRRNCGTMRRMMSPRVIPSTGTATTTSHDSDTSSRSAITMPPTMVIGAPTSSTRPMKVTVCTCVTSLVDREIRVGAPNVETSLDDRSATWWNRAPRRSRPRPMATWAANHTAPMVTAIWTRLTPNITAPSRRIRPVSPAAMPWSMMSAFRVGRYSVASVATVCSTTTMTIAPLTGARNRRSRAMVMAGPGSRGGRRATHRGHARPFHSRGTRALSTGPVAR